MSKKLALMVFLAILSTGCASNSAEFRKSPCACKYETLHAMSTHTSTGEMQ